MSVAHFYIPGKTPRHSKPFVSTGDRRTLVCVTFIRHGVRPNIVVPLWQTDDEAAQGWEGPRKSYFVSGKPSTELYIKILRENVFTGRVLVDDQLLSTRSSQLTLVHDRASYHTSKAFTAFAARSNINAKLLPPRAGDLDPLDYGVFSNVKREWRRQVQRLGLDWKGQCYLLIELLQDFDADASIRALPHKINACIKAQGRHFEKPAQP